MDSKYFILACVLTTTFILSLHPVGANTPVSLVAYSVVVAPPPPPVAVFTVSTDHGDAPLPVVFTDQSSGIITQWEWDYNGDGKVDATSTSPPIPQIFVFSSAGTYHAKLKITGPGGTNSAIKTITVTIPKPNAEFSVDKLSGKAPMTVKFTDQSTGTITKWEWDYNGDGKVDATFNTKPGPQTYKYNTGGIYYPKLTVTGPGGTDSATKTITVTPVPKPLAVFTATQTPGTLTVVFQDKSTGAISSWLWNFNDGSPTSPDQNPPPHPYARAGSYSPKLTVTGPGGTSSATNSLCVLPVADFTVSISGKKVTFTDTSLGSPTSYRWEFGDGSSTTTTQKVVTHMYQTAKSYSVTHTAYVSCGSGSVTRSVKIG